MNQKHVGLFAGMSIVLTLTVIGLEAQNKPRVTRDPVTGDYVVELLVGGSVRQLRYTPATKLQFRVRTKVEHAAGDRQYRYHFTFENDSRSQQELYSIALIGTMPAEIADTPPGWEPNHISSTGRLYWYRIVRGYGLEGIPAGSRLGGFTVTSEFLPGPAEIHGSGNVGAPEIPEGTPGEMIDALDDVMRRDYVVSPTIGPSIPAGLNEPELTPEVQLSRVRAAFGTALIRSRAPAALRVEQALGRATQAFEAGNAAEGRRYLQEARKESAAMTATPWLVELGDALRLNLDHIERRFRLA